MTTAVKVAIPANRRSLGRRRARSHPTMPITQHARAAKPASSSGRAAHARNVDALVASKLTWSAAPARIFPSAHTVIAAITTATPDRNRRDGPLVTLYLRHDTPRHGVLAVPLDDLPEWLPAWCRDHLGHEPAAVLLRLQQISMVFGLRLRDGSEVVVKARADDGRAVSCVAAQARLAERGFPCALPLTSVIDVGGLAVHAEEYRPGGDVLRGDSPDVAVHYAGV